MLGKCLVVLLCAIALVLRESIHFGGPTSSFNGGHDAISLDLRHDGRRGDDGMQGISLHDSFLRDAEVWNWMVPVHEDEDILRGYYFRV